MSLSYLTHIQTFEYNQTNCISHYLHMNTSLILSTVQTAKNLLGPAEDQFCMSFGIGVHTKTALKGPLINKIGTELFGSQLPSNISVMKGFGAFRFTQNRLFPLILRNVLIKVVKSWLLTPNNPLKLPVWKTESSDRGINGIHGNTKERQSLDPTGRLLFLLPAEKVLIVEPGGVLPLPRYGRATLIPANVSHARLSSNLSKGDRLLP